MLSEEFAREALLLGDEAINTLSHKHVAVFGVGGVGGYICEMLARSGIGKITLIDSDVLSVSNINRQIIALHSAIGQYKTHVMKNRILDINPNVVVNTHELFITQNNIKKLNFEEFDYVADAIDTMTSKILLVQESRKNSVPIISSMGAANRLDPTCFEIADIFSTSMCPVARIMRRELKKLNIERLDVVYSKEEPIRLKNSLLGSISFVPPIPGILMASRIIRNLLS